MKSLYNLSVNLSRAEIKKIIRETICPAFITAGFPNPGISMWRWRETFVDVLHFYIPSNTTDFAIEFGCHPRKIVRPHPLPWHCMFRNRIHYPDKKIFSGDFLKTAETIEQERKLLIKITPYVFNSALAWWAKFSTVENALDLLLNSSEADLDSIFTPRKGSVAFNQNLAILQSLIDM
jgi:hypothetical protein